MNRSGFLKVVHRYAQWWPTALLSATLLLVGVFYYGAYRSPVARPDLWLPMGNYHASWIDFSAGSLPSFVHALALFVLVGFSLRSARVARRVVWAWVSACLWVLLAIEVFFGTFSLLDVFVTFVSVPIAFGLVNRLKRANVSQVANHRWFPAVALSFFSWMAIATSDDGYGYNSCVLFDDDGVCQERETVAYPIYMSYANLRSAVRSQAPQPLNDVGRIYIYDKYLFINERNRGIHVVDNSDPFAPLPLAFINLPGNMDVEIRGNTLYADSFIDLVTLDISNPAAVTVLNRVEDIFPYDAEQALPYNVRLRSGSVNRRAGVVVSYKLEAQ